MEFSPTLAPAPCACACACLRWSSKRFFQSEVHQVELVLAARGAVGRVELAREPADGEARA
eukprot:7246281-Heterocapsa_arctica.AAC.1